MATALVIIDMQQGSFTEATPRHDARRLVERLNALSGRVRRSGGTVIFVQHDGPEGDPHHPDAPGWHLLPELDVRQSDRFVRKTACDAFLDTELASLLEKIAARRLILTGCATDFCVDTTVRAALARGYATFAPGDGHTTTDRPHLDAPTIIAHHNAIWPDLASPAGGADVRPCAEIAL